MEAMTGPTLQSFLPRIGLSNHDSAGQPLAVIDGPNDEWSGARYGWSDAVAERCPEAIPRPHPHTGGMVAQDQAEIAVRLLIDAPQGGCALHFEAGAGELLPFIAERFDEVVAVDSSPLHVRRSRGTVKPCQDGRLPFPDGIFDFVCGTLDPAPRWRLRQYVTDAHRVLVSGGVLRLRAGRGCSNWRLQATLGASPFEDFNPGAYSVQRRWVTARKR